MPRKLKSKLSLRFRVGTHLGNAQSSNDVYVAAVNGDVMRTRSIVRVIESSRWSKKAVMGVQGTPDRLRMLSQDQSDAFIEELADPHQNGDSIDEKMEESKLDESSVKTIDKQLRITLKDLQEFGFTDGCPRCEAMQAGEYRTKKLHSEECRLRLYLPYQQTNHPK